MKINKTATKKCLEIQILQILSNIGQPPRDKSSAKEKDFKIVLKR